MLLLYVSGEPGIFDGHGTVEYQDDLEGSIITVIRMVLLYIYGLKKRQRT